ncbi:MAG: NAD(P)-dependent oxidoreductase [Gemmataceae bacterium]
MTYRCICLRPRTRHIINRESLSLMKPTAFLINTARGRVNEADLAEALAAKKIAGARLDVFEQDRPRRIIRCSKRRTW